MLTFNATKMYRVKSSKIMCLNLPHKYFSSKVLVYHKFNLKNSFKYK